MGFDDFDHPIVKSGGVWQITSLHLELAAPEPYLDLTICNESEKRRFRFWSPRMLHLSDDAAHDAPGGLSVGLRVSDVSARGMENLRVRFYDYEFHALEFWARDVIDLDRSNSTATS